MGVSIIELAISNETTFAALYKKALNAGIPEPLIVNFLGHLTKSLKVSVNVEYKKLLKIIDEQAYKNAFEATGDYSEAVKHYGGRGKYRIIIDNHFENGRLFKYFALNSGNMGVPTWGTYCLIFSIPYFDYEKTVILLRNSLEKKDSTKMYYFDGEKLNEHLFGIDLVRLSNSKEICLLKIHKKLEGVGESEWPDLVCSCNNVTRHDQTSYLEVITFQHCEVKDNFILRLKKDKVGGVFDNFKHIGSGKKVPAWEIIKKEFSELKKVIKDNSIKLELI